MFWSCCGLGRRRRSSSNIDQEPDETTRLLSTSDALFPQILHEAPKPIDDEALLEYKRRIDRILEDTAEKLIAVNTNPHPLTHTRSNTSSASTSTARASASNSAPSSAAARNGSTVSDDANVTTGTGRETLWRAEGTARADNPNIKGSIYSMKNVSKQSSKARGKQAAKAEPKLPNGYSGNADHPGENNRDDDQHHRDSTAATYRTAQEQDDDEDDTDEQEEDGDDQSSNTEGADSSLDEERSEGRSQQQDRSKRPRPAQDIFTSDLGTIGKMKTQARLQKALALPDDDFARQLTQL